MAKSPQELMIIGLIETLWEQMKDSSTSVFREIGQDFVDEYEKLGMDLSTPEAALDSVNQYFTEVFDFADSVEYEIDGDNVMMTVDGCSFRPMTDHFEAKGIPRTACPYANSAVIALEKATGDIYIFDHVELESDTVCKLLLKKFDL